MIPGAIFKPMIIKVIVLKIKLYYSQLCRLHFFRSPGFVRFVKLITNCLDLNCALFTMVLNWQISYMFLGKLGLTLAGQVIFLISSLIKESTTSLFLYFAFARKFKTPAKLDIYKTFAYLIPITVYILFNWRNSAINTGNLCENWFYVIQIGLNYTIVCSASRLFYSLTELPRCRAQRNDPLN
jgi:hypothetical protein